jgi:hypothetical protein
MMTISVKPINRKIMLIPSGWAIKVKRETAIVNKESTIEIDGSKWVMTALNKSVSLLGFE